MTWHLVHWLFHFAAFVPHHHHHRPEVIVCRLPGPPHHIVQPAFCPLWRRWFG